MYIKINATVAFIGKAVVQNLLHQLLLLNDVSCGVRFNAGWQHVQRLHGGVIAVGIILCYLHGLELLQACLLLYFVVTLIGIVLQVSYVGNVAHITHLIALVLEVAKQHVEGDGRTGVSQVWIAINGGSAHIHAHMRSVDGLKQFLLSCQRVVYYQRLCCHCVYNLTFELAKVQ